MSDYLNAITGAVQKGNEKLVVQIVTEALNAGIAPQEILNKGLISGIQAVGQLFKDGEAYLPEVMISTRATRNGIEKLKPHLAGVDILKKGTVVIGSVKGDMHDIGKNLVKLMLEIRFRTSK